MDKVQGILKKAMEQVVKLSVPLLIDMHAGKNWAEAK
jgi:DNA polymerase-1